MELTIALIGNPNCGKTTLFNQLTGARQHVGNWPGVTVEKKEGVLQDQNNIYRIIDLPGIYSLSPYSMEEKVALDFILNRRPSLILNIVDGTNPERNLYLTLQLLELGIPVVVAVNMIDELQKQGGDINCALLSKTLSIPIFPISAKTGDGLSSLIQGFSAARQPVKPGHIAYDKTTRQALDEMIALLRRARLQNQAPIEFYAARLLEGSKETAKELRLSPTVSSLCDTVMQTYEVSSPYGDRETMLADARYRYIERLVSAICKKQPRETGRSVSDRIDQIATNKYLAIPVFLLAMFCMFAITFGPLGNALKSGMEFLMSGRLAPALASYLERIDASYLLSSLLLDGVLPGVGGVLSFLPQIMLLFLSLSIMEDSGYMARAAFIMDRLLRKIGLSGKAFIPMLMGFGCSVPAIMAARTMEQEKARWLTIILVPFLSCGARLPIYALFAMAFFPQQAGLVIFSIYLLGIVTAIFCGLLLKKTAFSTGQSAFIMELPPYRLPAFKNTLLHMWDKCKGFLTKAGTLIFAMSIIVWLLQNFSLSLHLVSDPSQSMFGKLGTLLAPLLTPLGFGFWQAAVALLSGLIAKEAVVSSMLVLYGAANTTALAGMLPAYFNPASAYAFMAFTLLYMPCVAAAAAMKKELGSWKKALLTVLFQTGVAYAVSFLVFRLGTLFL